MSALERINRILMWLQFAIFYFILTAVDPSRMFTLLRETLRFLGVRTIPRPLR